MHSQTKPSNTKNMFNINVARNFGAKGAREAVTFFFKCILLFLSTRSQLLRTAAATAAACDIFGEKRGSAHAAPSPDLLMQKPDSDYDWEHPPKQQRNLLKFNSIRILVLALRELYKYRTWLARLSHLLVSVESGRQWQFQTWLERTWCSVGVGDRKEVWKVLSLVLCARGYRTKCSASFLLWSHLRTSCTRRRREAINMKR